MKKRFQIITVYEGCISKAECVSEIQSALTAASIYWMDPECLSVTIYDFKNDSTILNYDRPD